MNRQVKLCAITTISKTMDWFIIDNMRNLAQNGYEITLISNMDEDFVARNSDFAKCIDVKMSRGTKSLDTIKMPFRLRKIFKREKFDVIYYMTPNAAFYASVGGMLAGIKHRVYGQSGIRYVSLKGIKRLIFKTVEKITCMCSTTIRSQSPKNMQFAIDEGLCKKDKISVVGIGGTTGVSLAACDKIDKAATKKQFKEKYKIPDNAFVYGFVGRINRDKGVGELIEAFLKLDTDAYLVLVGMRDEKNLPDLSALQKAENSDRIIFTGNVPPSEVYNYMAMFDMIIHPTYREGFGKVLQEAMGMGLPIITTDVPGPSEVVEKDVSGLLVPHKNVELLSEKMQLLYDDASLREKLSQNGRKRAEKYFDRPIMLQNQLNAMNELVEEK